jgi:hypothetical protein
MGKRLNCWEFKKCGKEPEGAHKSRPDACPAARATVAHGVNGGMNGGRICWAISGTLSEDIVKGAFAKDMFSCINCDFFKLVEEEEADNFALLTPDQLRRYRSRIYGKRKYMRRDVHLDMELKSTTVRAGHNIGVVKNLSCDGLCFRSMSARINPEGPIECEIKHPENDIFLSVLGDVVWKKDVTVGCEVGVKFRGIEKELKREVLNYSLNFQAHDHRLIL